MRLLPALGGALATACLFASAASAATVTRSFQFHATGFQADAPLADVTGTFTLTFDPLGSSSGSLDALSISHPGLGFSSASTGFSYVFGGMPQFSPLTVGGLAGGVGAVSPGVSDFAISFMGAGTDPFSYLPLNFTYSTGTGQTWSGDFQVTTYTPAPIPEPGVWAMMILGFGLAGQALRSRAWAKITT